MNLFCCFSLLFKWNSIVYTLSYLASPIRHSRVACVIVCSFYCCTVFYCMNSPYIAGSFSVTPNLRQRLARSIVTRKCPWDDSCGTEGQGRGPAIGRSPELCAQPSTVSANPTGSPEAKMVLAVWICGCVCRLPQEGPPWERRLLAIGAMLKAVDSLKVLCQQHSQKQQVPL